MRVSCAETALIQEAPNWVFTIISLARKFFPPGSGSLLLANMQFLGHALQQSMNSVSLSFSLN